MDEGVSQTWGEWLMSLSRSCDQDGGGKVLKAMLWRKSEQGLVTVSWAMRKRNLL